ncbi:hypothetical protein [Mesobacterium pallidum]|uniref:hypothetical protein n=1 Tax=Mesobacterium pallidum TaxID=2872037 RepID=UPI001EE22BDC|nr:hypothetical protein [Mesobacterium pallidum]
MNTQPDQLGFQDLLEEAAAGNAARRFAKETKHLPGDMQAARACHREQIETHHTAMLACDFDAALAIRKEAHQLARKLNGGNPGILAHDDAPGNVLARDCAALPGDMPLWGQEGTFCLSAAGAEMSVRFHGMFGIGATAMPYLGFEIRATDPAQPFVSATGYRSFLGVSVAPKPGMIPAAFACRVVEVYVAEELEGRLVAVRKA